MTVPKKSFFISIFCFFLIPAHSQQDNIQTIRPAEWLEYLAQKAPPELTYIQTSKDIYECGEDLWFKVYLLNSKDLTPSYLSKTLFIQLLYENNMKIVWQEKYEINNGFSDGRIFLAADLAEGNYLLTAFTTNSFFGDSSEFKAVRKIELTKNITSRLPVITQFDNSFYKVSDTIKIKLFPLNEPRDSVNGSVIATLRNGNKKLQNVETRTDPAGRATVIFLPTNEFNGKYEVSISTKIEDLQENIVLPVTSRANPVQFVTFPEGGDLVSGIESRLAFKSVNSNGEPVDVKGKLFENDIPVSEFISGHAGMGSINFTPQHGKKYTIRLSEPAIDSLFILPEIKDEGMTLSLVNRDKESLDFRITKSFGLRGNNFFLLVQSRGVVFSFTKGTINREIRIRVPLYELPEGITEVTLFNNDLVPVAERLVFVNPSKKLTITAELSQEKYETRNKITAKINVRDENGKPASANLGISVFDKLYQNPRDSGNIFTQCYLSTQLKGRIYNPAYYFNNNKRENEEALDLLMLTQGWRRYVWSEYNLKQYKEVQKQIVTDGIKGNLVFQKNTKKIPKEESFVMAFSPNKDSTKALLFADSSGIFFVNPDLMKRWEDDYVYMKPLSPQGYQLAIKIADPFAMINEEMKSHEISYPIPPLIKSQEKSPFIFTPEPGVIMIKEVTIKGKRTRSDRGKYMGTLDSLANALTFDNDYVCRYGVLNCPRHSRDEFGTTKPIEGQQYAVIYLYENPMEYVQHIRYSRPKFTEDEILKMTNLNKAKAYYGHREFYQPNYDNGKGDIMVPDYRNTLLWAPSVITDENGEATISFYSSDINSEFVGRIEGISNNGLLGEGSFKFSVRKVILSP